MAKKSGGRAGDDWSGRVVELEAEERRLVSLVADLEDKEQGPDLRAADVAQVVFDLANARQALEAVRDRLTIARGRRKTEQTEQRAELARSLRPEELRKCEAVMSLTEQLWGMLEDYHRTENEIRGLGQLPHTDVSAIYAGVLMQRRRWAVKDRKRWG